MSLCPLQGGGLPRHPQDTPGHAGHRHQAGGRHRAGGLEVRLEVRMEVRPLTCVRLHTQLSWQDVIWGQFYAVNNDLSNFVPWQMWQSDLFEIEMFPCIWTDLFVRWTTNTPICHYNPTILIFVMVILQVKPSVEIQKTQTIKKCQLRWWNIPFSARVRQMTNLSVSNIFSGLPVPKTNINHVETETDMSWKQLFVPRTWWPFLQCLEWDITNVYRLHWLHRLTVMHCRKMLWGKCKESRSSILMN